MIELNSIDKFHITDRGDVYIVKSPVECERQYNNFVESCGRRVIIDGKEFDIIGVEMLMPATKIRIGEHVCLLVKEVL